MQVSNSKGDSRIADDWGKTVRGSKEPGEAARRLVELDLVLN
jgi:hypothetical protein